jgi:hypothetical protein
MSRIEQGRWSELLRRYTGAAGVTEVASELAPEIAPAFVLETERPEWYFLKGERLMGYRINVSALAGQNSGVKLRNPTTSGIIAIVTKLDISGDATNQVVTLTTGADTADFTTVSGTVPRDGRWLAINGACVVSFQNNAAGGNSFDGGQVPLAFETYRVIDYTVNPFVLMPGFSLRILSANVNFNLLGSIAWLEKRLDQLEQGSG